MASDESPTISETIKATATENVRNVMVDGMNVSGHSLHELIEADKHQKRQIASSNPFGSLRAAKLRSPSTA